jgi:hypothetical protein
MSSNKKVSSSRVLPEVSGNCCGKILAWTPQNKISWERKAGITYEVPDEDDLIDEEDAVHDKPLPFNVVQTDRVNEGGEESSSATPELEDGNTLGTLHVRPDLNKIRYPKLVLRQM